MGNLIDRELLIKKLDEHCNTVCQYPKSIRDVMCGGCPLGTAFDVVGEIPSAEPELATDCISRQAAIDALMQHIEDHKWDQFQGALLHWTAVKVLLQSLPPAEPEIIRCKDCKHNPNITWFECPMSHLSESQRPETAWCWKAERRTDERFD